MGPDTDDPIYKTFLQWRGVQDPCPRCRGSGLRYYSSTATWHGGMGGSAGTQDVCDLCWGTGDANRHGVDLRAQQNDWNQAVATAAGGYLSWSVGGTLKSTHQGILFLAEELERLSRKRGSAVRPPYVPELASSLAKSLRKMLIESK